MDFLDGHSIPYSSSTNPDSGHHMSSHHLIISLLAVRMKTSKDTEWNHVSSVYFLMERHASCMGKQLIPGDILKVLNLCQPAIL